MLKKEPILTYCNEDVILNPLRSDVIISIVKIQAQKAAVNLGAGEIRSRTISASRSAFFFFTFPLREKSVANMQLFYLPLDGEHRQGLFLFILSVGDKHNSKGGGWRRLIVSQHLRLLWKRIR